jgi:hypothetical protein
MQVKIIFPIITIVFLLSCGKQNQTAAIPKAIHDTVTITVHDTITVSDPDLVETIHYYKRLTEKLFRATVVVQLNTPESDAELKRLNDEIITERQQHNNRVNESFVSDIKSIVSR